MANRVPRPCYCTRWLERESSRLSTVVISCRSSVVSFFHWTVLYNVELVVFHYHQGVFPPDKLLCSQRTFGGHLESVCAFRAVGSESLRMVILTQHQEPAVSQRGYQREAK